MWWMALVGAANGLIQGQATRATAKANNRISQVNADTRNKTRVFSNAAEMAKGRLARFEQGLMNNRLLDTAGNNQAAVTQNFIRGQDAQTQQGLSRAIGEAEQQGAMAAAAGAVGQIGGVVDMVNTSTRLRDAIVERQVQDNQTLQSYDNAKQRGKVMSQALRSMDSSIIVDTLDWNKDYATITPVVSNWANAIQGAGASFGATQIADMMRNNTSQSSGSSSSDSGAYKFTDADIKKYARFGFSTQTTTEGDDFKIDLGTKLRLGEQSYGASGADANKFSLWGSSNYGSN